MRSAVYLQGAGIHFHTSCIVQIQSGGQSRGVCPGALFQKPLVFQGGTSCGDRNIILNIHGAGVVVGQYCGCQCQHSAARDIECALIDKRGVEDGSISSQVGGTGDGNGTAAGIGQGARNPVHGSGECQLGIGLQGATIFNFNITGDGRGICNLQRGPVPADGNFFGG